MAALRLGKPLSLRMFDGGTGPSEGERDGVRKVRVCIVDDSVTMRAMLGHMLEDERGLEVVGVVDDTAETSAFIRRVRPDVVTIDGTREEGFVLLDRLMAEWPVPVIAITPSTDPEEEAVKQAATRGAIACFAKREVGLNAAGLVKLVKKASAMKPRLRKDAIFA